MSNTIAKQTFKDISKEDLTQFEEIFTSERLIYERDKLENYGRDYTEDLHFWPAVVVFPRTTEEVSSLMKYCFRENIAVTPSGARTGLSGGALPVSGGVVLSFEKMNQLIEIDEKNFTITTQPGVITQVLQEAVAERGLYYPPDPASRGSCFIGGNIAENSGGPHAVKYGTTKDYVLNLEVVLPNGDVIWTGANTVKNATGFNLTQLITGSEGTLAIVTKAVLRLVPLPSKNMLMLVPFKSARQACEAVSAIMRAGVIPSVLEFMERDAIKYTLQYTQVEYNIPEEMEAHLLIEVDGNYEEEMMRDCESIAKVVAESGAGDPLMAMDQSEKDKLWKLRRSVGEAVKRHSTYKEEDTVVPRYQLPQLLEGVKSIGEKYGFESVCYGHAGDGNLHVNILKGNLSEDAWNTAVNKGIREIFQKTIELGGTISGEHGIGWVQKSFMDLAFSEETIDLMRGIKNVFDPRGILNPGKVIPAKKIA